MLFQRVHPLLFILVLLILASLACQVPETADSPSASVVVRGTTQPVSPATLSPDTLSTVTVLPKKSTSPAAKMPTPHPGGLVHRIAIHRIYGLAEFYDHSTLRKFIPRGVNYAMLVPVQDHYENRLFATGIYNHSRIQADFAALSSAGYNTLRIIFDGCTSGDTCIGLQEGQGLNPAYLDNMVDLLTIAKANQLYVLFASSDLPELGGYAGLANQGAKTYVDAGRNATLLTAQGIRASQQYWSDLLSGLAERKAPFDIILGWEILAEQFFPANQLPFSTQSGRVQISNGKNYDLARPAQQQAMAIDGLRKYIDEIKATILTYDPSALVSMGFLAPDNPNTWREGDNRLVVSAPLLENSSLDFFDLHANPGSGLSIAEISQNFGLNSHVDKPVIMGSVGASTWAYPEISAAAIVIQDWIAASCTQGFAGWLYSAFYPYPAGLAEAAWSFTDDHSLLFNDLAPSHQPDACTTTTLPGRNIALGKPAQVSAALPEQPPEMAVDGDPTTQWSAGEYATQYIELDLGAPYAVGEIRLTVGQWPDGKTVHQLWVGASRDAMQLVQTFSGYTYDMDVLDYIPPTPLINIRYLKLVTTESPAWVSWREIEVLAPFPATPTPTPTPAFTATP